jgi:hypothetical protein
MIKKYFTILFILMYSSAIEAQYISEVLEYKPAPGQFINASPWGVPASTSSLVGTLTGSMSLGAYGGYVIFKFSNPVENHPDNPYGIDFVIYGNPLKNLSNPKINNNVTWSEPGIVSVMKDKNANGLPDDTWYELAGSDYFFSTTLKKYSVTYTNPNDTVAKDVPWTDKYGGNGNIKANAFHLQPYYPLGVSFPEVGQTSYILSGTRLQNNVDTSNPSFVIAPGRPWGYADNNLRATYNGLPDNPYTDNIEEGSGGDAFDIHWAVDTNGIYVDLDQVHFIRVQNGILANAGWLGESSTEITGAFDIAPNTSVSGETDFIHIRELPDTIYTNMFPVEVFAYHKGRWQKDRIINWNFNNDGVSINTENIIFTDTTGDITITAALADKPGIKADVKTYIKSLELVTKPGNIVVNDTTPDTLIDLSTLFTDPEDSYAKITIAVVSGYNDTVISALVDSQTLELSFLQAGISYLLLKGETNGKSAYYQMLVTVNSINGPYVAMPIDDITVESNAADTVISLASTFLVHGHHDSIITRSITSNSNDFVVSANITDDTLYLSFLNPGSSILTIEGKANGKSAFASFSVTVKNPSFINNQYNQVVPVCLFPNPAGDYITISGIQRATICIYDLSGNLLMQEHKYQGGALSVAHLKKGLYLVRINMQNRNVIFRLIKQ